VNIFGMNSMMAVIDAPFSYSLFVQPFKQIRGKHILISENLKCFGTDLQEEVGQQLDISA